MSPQPQPQARQGFWAPRNRLKILAALVVFQCVTLFLLMTTSYQPIPRWINPAMIAANLLLAGALWIAANRKPLTVALSGVVIAILLARDGLGAVSLAYRTLRPENVASAVMNTGWALAVLVFVYVTLRAIRRENRDSAASPITADAPSQAVS